MDKITTIYRRIADDHYLGEGIYLLAFAMYLTMATLRTTAFPFPNGLNRIVMVIFLAACVFKIAIYDGYTGWQLLLIGIGAIGVFGRYATGIGGGLIVLFFMVVAAKDVDFDKIVQVYLYVAGSIVLLALVAAMLKIIPNYHWYDRFQDRYGLGIRYCTDAAAHYFFLLLSYFYIRRDRLKLIEYAIAIIYTILIYKYTGGKLDVGCNIITIIVFAMGNLFTKNRGLKRRISFLWEKICKILGLVSMPILALVISLFTYLYSDDRTVLVKIDNIITHRLSISHQTIAEYGLALFGKNVILIGEGKGTENVRGSYNYVDCSYLQIALLYGIVIALLIVAVYMLISLKNVNSSCYIQYALAIIAINATIAHHLMDPAYNIFTLAVLAKINNGTNRDMRNTI